jgi:nicotinate dehydrogenase subunit B
MSVPFGVGADTSRRGFLKRMGAGVVVLLTTHDLFAMSGNDPWPLDGADQDTTAAPTDQIAAWIHIAASGDVTVFTGKVEVGQGIRTSLAQHVAEELRVPIASIRMVMGDTDLTPFDQGTFGSLSTPQMGPQLRRAAASARELFIGLAADQWKVDRGTLAAADGAVHDHANGRMLTYGQLTAGRQLTETIRTDLALRAPADWTIAGTSVPKVGARDIVTGRHQYTSDVRVDGMLHGRVLRAPATGATMAGVDTSAAQAISGVVVVRDGEFVGVASGNSADAERAIAAMSATWTLPQPGTSSGTVYDFIRRTPPAPAAGGARGGEGGGGASPYVLGNFDGALASAAHALARTYTIAYIAHVPLEPRAAVAAWERDAQGEKLTVWTGTQRPFGVRDELARAFGLDSSRVHVIMPDTGSGYGGKHTGECAIEAARLARGASRPVKLVWTREEEFRWAYFRPAGVIDVSAGVLSDGTITAWSFDNYNSGPAAIRPSYAIANQRVTYHPSESPLRQGSYRGLAATANNFAREMHVDELAHMVGMDTLAFRVRNISDVRLRAALEAAAERFGWGKSLPQGHGAGIACGFEKGGYIATCAEVAVDATSGEVRIVRAVSAFDCGAVVNPDGLRNQISGAMVMGIGGALFEAIDFQDGVIRNAHLREYRVPRFSDVPAIDVVLIDRKDVPPAGAGETPIMGLAPAVGAAIFAASGIRVRSLPMARGGVKRSAASDGGG